MENYIINDCISKYLRESALIKQNVFDTNSVYEFIKDLHPHLHISLNVIKNSLIYQATLEDYFTVVFKHTCSNCGYTYTKLDDPCICGIVNKITLETVSPTFKINPEYIAYILRTTYGGFEHVW